MKNKATQSDFVRDNWEEAEQMKWRLRHEKDTEKKKELWAKVNKEHILIPSDLRD